MTGPSRGVRTPWHRVDARGRAALLCLVLLTVGVPLARSQQPPESAPALQTQGAAPIAVTTNARSDTRIAARLQELYDSIEGLGGVTVKVDAGIVRLSGEVPSRAAHDQALALGRRVEQVVDIQDQLTESRDVQSRLTTTVDRLRAQATDLLGLLPLLGVAAVVLAIFWWLGWLIPRSGLFNRVFRANAFLQDLARQLLRLLLIGTGIVLALQLLDASTVLTTLLGAAGVVGLALGFALRDTVENYIASLLLSLRQPFARDDHVVIEGYEGRVLRLTPRATLLMSLDGNHTRIPNAKVYKAIIINYTRNPKRRFQFDVGVDTEQNLAHAQELATRTLQQMEGVLDEPAPYCTVESLGDSNVILRVFGWVDQTSANFPKVRSESIRLVKRAFDDAGIVMPEPIYNLRLQNASANPAAVGTVGTASVQPAAAPRLESMQAGAPPTEVAQALDIAVRDDLVAQIAADRSAADSEDLLSAKAPQE